MKNIEKEIKRDMVLTSEQFKQVGFVDTNKLFGDYRIYKICNHKYFVKETEEGYRIGFNFEVEDEDN